jgi:hypothetical protein
MRLLTKLRAYAQVLPRASRNRTDLTRHLLRRPLIGWAVGTYESAVFLSNSVDGRVKALATTRVSSLVGCPF